MGGEKLEQAGPHAIMIAYPMQGHIIPFVNLAMKLASKGFTITFINTQFIHHQITNSQSNGPTATDDDIFVAARKSGLDIRYAVVNDGFPLGFDRSLNHDQFMEGLLHVFSAHVDQLIGDLIKSDPSITCLISDTFYVWPSLISKKHKLINISFWTEPALILTLYYHLDLLRTNSHFDSKANRTDMIDYIPGVCSIKPTDLMSYLQATDTTTPVHRIIYKAFHGVKSADFILCNTVEELEPETISALNERQPTYAIGPIFPPGFRKKPVATSLWSESDCTQWLNNKSSGSVLYVSFGSYAHTSKHDIVEIAHGLLQSRVTFILVLRPDIVSSDDTDFLPRGFHDEVKDQGLIVTWCNQTAVLSHPSIGGFLTHCGWNSLLESIWCGVPLICFPLVTDQLTNRKLVVDDWKIGINLCDKKLVTRGEVAEKINRLMHGETSEKLRIEIKKVKNTLENALTKQGSSQKSFDQFIDHVKIKIRDTFSDMAK